MSARILCSVANFVVAMLALVILEPEQKVEISDNRWLKIQESIRRAVVLGALSQLPNTFLPSLIRHARQFNSAGETFSTSKKLKASSVVPGDPCDRSLVLLKTRLVGKR